MAKTKSTSTSKARFEVSQEKYGVIEHVSRFDHARSGKMDAVTIAQNWIESKKFSAELGSVLIYDRMAHHGKPQLWKVEKCPGEAHSNPRIDHCGVCMPRWGIVVKVLHVRSEVLK